MLGKLYGSPEGKCYGEKLGEGGEASFWREGEQTLPQPGEPAPRRRGAAGRAGTLLPRVPGLTFHAQLAPRASFSSDLGR